MTKLHVDKAICDNIPYNIIFHLILHFTIFRFKQDYICDRSFRISMLKFIFGLIWLSQSPLSKHGIRAMIRRDPFHSSYSVNNSSVRKIIVALLMTCVRAPRLGTRVESNHTQKLGRLVSRTGVKYNDG